MFLIKFQSKKLRTRLYIMGQILNVKNNSSAGNTYRKNAQVIFPVLLSGLEPFSATGTAIIFPASLSES